MNKFRRVSTIWKNNFRKASTLWKSSFRWDSTTGKVILNKFNVSKSSFRMDPTLWKSFKESLGSIFFCRFSTCKFPSVAVKVVLREASGKSTSLKKKKKEIWKRTHLCRLAHLLLKVSSSAVKLIYRCCKQLGRLLSL